MRPWVLEGLNNLLEVCGGSGRHGLESRSPESRFHVFLTVPCALGLACRPDSEVYSGSFDRVGME